MRSICRLCAHVSHAAAGTIQLNIEAVQGETSRVLHEQEKDLLRSFRARLLDVQSELEKEKSKCVEHGLRPRRKDELRRQFIGAVAGSFDSLERVLEPGEHL